MGPILSDEELQRIAGDEVLRYVRELRVQVETHKARADAAVINAEQSCSLIEQKFLSLTGQFSQLENEKQRSIATLERRSGELASAQAQAHKLELEAIKQSSDLERLSLKLGEVRKSKRDLLDIIEQKNTELDEKNASMKSYLDKIVCLTDGRSSLEGKLRERDAELSRSHVIQSRLQQEKELLEQHNSWLNDELTARVKALMDERRTSAELEADLQSKLIQAEKCSKEANDALQRTKGRVGDLEAKLSQTREELRFTKEQAAIQEDHLSAEIATATKLADLYKESSDDWSNKSNELEGVIKALETHLNQVESDYRDELGREIEARETIAKEAAHLKEKLDKVLMDRDADIFTLPCPPKDGSESRQFALELHGEGVMTPSITAGVSGTALAAALLRDGWSLSKMYSKYQEAVDAWRHERNERKHSQTLLERVLQEIELKAEVILEERAEHERMIESYRIMEEKLHYCMEDQSSLENTIKDLKVDLRKKQRETKGAQKEISDLQIQVAGLLKECAEIKQRYEAVDLQQNGDALLYYATSERDSSVADVVISEKLVTFKDIKGMVEQNSQLRVLVRDLAQESEHKESELKEFYSAELNRRADAAASKVAEVLRQYKEKDEIIVALQGTVTMYKRLHEEELKSRYTSHDQIAMGAELTTGDGGAKDYVRLLHLSQEEIQSLRKETATHIETLEKELTAAKLELTNARIEQGRVDAERALARDQMVSLTKDAEERRKQMDAVLERNMEFSLTITKYQQQLRESSQNLQVAVELSNKLTIQASILEKEKELLASAEKRASEEVTQLSDRAHRLQASLDAFQSIEEARETARALEVKKLQDDWSRMQMEWTEARKELELERRHSRDLTVLRDIAAKEAMDRVDSVSKELADTLKALSAAETRAQVSELRYVEVEASLKKSDEKIVLALTGGRRTTIGNESSSEIDAEILSNLKDTREELQQLKEDLVAAKGHTEQYKGIADANEEALRQLEAAYNRYKSDVNHMKEAMEADIQRSKEKVLALEADILEKEAASTARNEAMQVALNEAQREITNLQSSLSSSRSAFQEADVRIMTLKQEVDKYRHQWRDSQHNYERQILLQAQTIRELTTASERLTKLEVEEAAVRVQAETAEAQLASLQVSWAMEKSSLEFSKVDAENRLKSVEEQNRLLLDRLEAMHITSAERASKSSAETGNEVTEDKGDTDLQNVIRYLRRSKETVETEVSLLKQERLRLQRQLDGALRAAEDAQSSLRREQENVRAHVYANEEFKSLQAQAREINLMRESNLQLREENRRNFDDSRESREKMQKAYAELEPLKQQLREKDVELDSARKEIDLQRVETERWQNRVSQLLEKYRAIDVEDYQRVKTELNEIQELLKVCQGELEGAKKECEVIGDKLEKLRNDANEKDSRLNEQEKKLQDAMQTETTMKAELEKFRRHNSFMKRRLESVIKEKDDLIKENEAMSKQVEELKATAGKRISTEARQEAVRQEATLRQEATRIEQVQKELENVLKEKETRIQILEKTLERERESVRKEKMLRQRDQKTFYDVAQKAVQEKKRFLDELETFKREKFHTIERQGSGLSAAEPSSKSEIEERAATYLAAVNAISEVADGVLEQIMQQSTSLPITAVPSGPQSTFLNSSETAQPLPGDSTVAVVGTTAGGSVAASMILTGAGVPVVSAAAAGTALGSTSGTSSTVNAVSSATLVARPPIRPASSHVPLTATRPPLRPPAAQALVPDQKAREMAQLRAQIQEKEKSQAQASVSQARKTARRLIRPRIEPEVVTELGETTVEGTTDLTDMDIEPEDTRLSVVSSETGELAATSMAVVQVQVPLGVVPLVDSSLPPSLAVNINTASVQPPSGFRKRLAITTDPNFSEETSIEFGKSENAPVQKRPRAVELSNDGILEESPPVSGMVLVDMDSKLQSESSSHERDQDDQAGFEIRVPDVSYISAATPDSLTAVICSPEHERERPATETSDNPPQKRPRFIRPESLLVSPQVLEKDEVILENVVLDKKLSASDPILPATDETNDAKWEVEVVAHGNASMEVLEQEQKFDSADLLRSSEQVHLGESRTGSDSQLYQVPAAEDTLGFISRTLSSTDIVNMSQSGYNTVSNEIVSEHPNMQDEPEVPFNQAVTDVMDVVTPCTESGIPKFSAISAEGPGTVAVQEGEDETEEGEISVDIGQADRTPVNESGAGDMVRGGFDQESKPADERDESSAQDTGPISSPSDDNAGDDLPPENQERSGGDIVLVLTDIKPGTSGVSDAGGQAQEQHTENLSMVTRHMVRSGNTALNTTIHLAERAREKAALRKGAGNPPSPAARGGRGRAARGGKRAPASSRGGRVISTGVRGRGQGGSSMAASPEASRIVQHAASGGSSQTDQAELNTPFVPSESLSREGEE